MFHRLSHKVDGIGSLDQDAILQSARKLYFDKDCVKINSTSFKRQRAYKGSLFSREETFHEVIELHLVDRCKKPEETVITPRSQISAAKGKDSDGIIEPSR